MWTKREHGFSTVEVLTSFAFLGIMVFYSYQMIERQTRTVNKANQNVEATTILFQMREILQGPGCRENFAGFGRVVEPGTIQSLKKIIRYNDGTSVLEDSFPVEGKGDLYKSETGLTIKSYFLSPSGINESIRNDRTYLIVNFNRNLDDSSFQRQIRIYVQDTNGAITDCSLSPFVREVGTWMQQGKILNFEVGKVGIRTKKLKETLNIRGGLYVTPPLSGCNKRAYGSIAYDAKRNAWTLCTNLGVSELSDKRALP